MIYQIDILNDAMVLLDEDGNSYECEPLAGLRAAKQMIQTWAAKYTLNVADSYRRLSDHFQQQ
jgi:hypothetical protein